MPAPGLVPVVNREITTTRVGFRRVSGSLLVEGGQVALGHRNRKDDAMNFETQSLNAEYRLAVASPRTPGRGIKQSA